MLLQKEQTKLTAWEPDLIKIYTVITLPSLVFKASSFLSLTSLLRGQLVKCLTTLLLKTLIFFVKKMREAFALLQKLLTFFQQKYRNNFKYWDR